MPQAGFEPAHQAPEACALSVELLGLTLGLYAFIEGDCS